MPCSPLLVHLLSPSQARYTQITRAWSWEGGRWPETQSPPTGPVLAAHSWKQRQATHGKGLPSWVRTCSCATRASSSRPGPCLRTRTHSTLCTGTAQGPLTSMGQQTASAGWGRQPFHCVCKCRLQDLQNRLQQTARGSETCCGGNAGGAPNARSSRQSGRNAGAPPPSGWLNSPPKVDQGRPGAQSSVVGGTSPTQTVRGGARRDHTVPQEPWTQDTDSSWQGSMVSLKALAEAGRQAVGLPTCPSPPHSPTNSLGKRVQSAWRARPVDPTALSTCEGPQRFLPV